MARRVEAPATLTQIDDSIWSIDVEMRDGPLRYIPLRSTLVRCAGGGVMISPVPMHDELVDAVNRLVDVRWIVAPNLGHHLFISGARQAFAAAELWVSPGLDDKIATLAVDGVLGDIQAGFEKELVPCLVDGVPRIRETVFFHRASRTLIVTDMLLNVVNNPSAVTRTVFKMIGGYGRVAQPFPWRLGAKDKALLGRCVAQVLTHDFDRIVPAHGAIVDDGKAAMEQVFAWLETDMA